MGGVEGIRCTALSDGYANNSERRACRAVRRRNLGSIVTAGFAPPHQSKSYIYLPLAE